MKQELFNDYARYFAQFTTMYQQETYERIIPRLRGDVLDAGAGCGKLAAFIQNDSKVNTYLGVDSSAVMVKQGMLLLSQINRSGFDLREGWIEDVTGMFDSIVSIQSFYSWQNSEKILSHLFERTVVGGELLLATANDNLDIELLIRQCSRGWGLHPDWPSYVEYNRMLSSLPDGRYVSLDILIGEIREAGFEVVDTDTTLFESGVNLVVATKPKYR